MKTKQTYEIGDPVWIHGVASSNNLVQGTVIKSLDLSAEGFMDTQYVISIPTHIEPLLEIRTWQTISQDELGPVGAFRDLGKNQDPDNKKMTHLGYYTSGVSETELLSDGPTPDQIMAALEKSQMAVSHGPLNLTRDLIKDNSNKPKRKYYNRKKKRESN